MRHLVVNKSILWAICLFVQQRHNRADTVTLLKYGQTAGGKLFSDAVMLINLRAAFNKVLARGDATISFAEILELHAIVTDGLLPSSGCGVPRNDDVTIGGTEYRPPVGREYITAELKHIAETAEKYESPFSRAVYLHCNLAYLQPFMDGNKRVARLMQAAALVAGGHTPMFFAGVETGKYMDAVLRYYETGDYQKYVDLFIAGHRKTLERFLPQTPLPPAR